MAKNKKEQKYIFPVTGVTATEDGTTSSVLALIGTTVVTYLLPANKAEKIYSKGFVRLYPDNETNSWVYRLKQGKNEYTTIFPESEKHILTEKHATRSRR